MFAEEERSESKENAGAKAVTKQKSERWATSNVAKMPKAATASTKKKARRGPEVVKVVRPAFIVEQQQHKKKARQKQAAPINQGPAQASKATNHDVQQRDYYVMDVGSGDDDDDEYYEYYDSDDDMVEVEVPEPTASEIRRFEHEEHQRRRKKRSQHLIEKNLSTRTQDKMAHERLRDPTVYIGNGKYMYRTPDYSPINRERFHETDFTPNTGSPPLKAKLDRYFKLEYFDQEEEYEEEEETEEEYEEEEKADKEEDVEGLDELHWYMESYYEPPDYDKL